MSHQLKKPYTDTQKANFIIKYNRKNGLKIVETETNLFALETNEMLIDGEPAINPDYEQEYLQTIKTIKLDENKRKLQEKRYGQTFTVVIQGQECVFDTTDETQRDLQTAALVTATGITYDDWATNNGITLNLTNQDIQTVFATFYSLVSPLYQTDLEYKARIENAKTVKEVESIEIVY